MTPQEFLDRQYARQADLSGKFSFCLALYEDFDKCSLTEDRKPIFEAARYICSNVELDRLDSVQIVALMTALVPWRGAIKEREELSERFKAVMKERHPGRAMALTIGLLG